MVLLRYRQPDRARPFRSPGAIGRLPLLPIAGFVAAAAMNVRIVSTSSGSKTFTVLSSAGATIFASGNRSNNYTSVYFALPGADTYTLLVDPAGKITPVVTLAVQP